MSAKTQEKRRYWTKAQKEEILRAYDRGSCSLADFFRKHQIHPDNCYEEQKIVPYDLLPFLRQGNILIENRHALMQESSEAVSKRKSVDKRGVKSDAAWLRDVLGDMASAKNILVINDEAHHAWRHRSEEKQTGIDKTEKERATCKGAGQKPPC